MKTYFSDGYTKSNKVKLVCLNSDNNSHHLRDGVFSVSINICQSHHYLLDKYYLITSISSFSLQTFQERKKWPAIMFKSSKCALNSLCVSLGFELVSIILRSKCSPVPITVVKSP